MPAQHSVDLETVESTVRRDQRNLRILLEDLEQDRELRFAPDCSDVIEFCHMNSDEVQQSAYMEGTRQCFLNSDQLLLVPSWAYEFLDYMHRIVVGNIESYGKVGGLDRFLSKYPQAEKFKALWEAQKYQQAESLYAKAGPWAQILSFTHDEELDRILGNSIRRFNVLVSQGTLVGLDAFTEYQNFSKDSFTYDAVLERLNEVRRPPENLSKNQVDARSFATLSALNQQTSHYYFSAVTSRYPRNAYYDVIEHATSEDHPKISLVRSSIISLLGKAIGQAAPGQEAEYLSAGLGLIQQIMDTLPGLEYLRSISEYGPADILSEEFRAAYGAQTELRGLLETYTEFFRAPVFRGLEKMGNETRQAKTLPSQHAAEVLSEGVLEDQMKVARRKLHDDAAELVALTKTIVAPGGSIRIRDRKLTELVDEIARDFDRQVY